MVGRAGREGHLWLFFEEPIQASYLMELDEFVRRQAKVRTKLEFFPKQNISNEGNGLRGPLGLNRKPEAIGSIGWFADCPGKVIEEQLTWFCESPLNRTEPMERLVDELWAKQEEELTIILPRRKCTVDPVKAFALLDPVADYTGKYFTCICPKCRQRRAYFYKDTGWLQCNRVYSCGYNVAADRWIASEGQRFRM